MPLGAREADHAWPEARHPQHVGPPRQLPPGNCADPEVTHERMCAATRALWTELLGRGRRSSEEAEHGVVLDLRKAPVRVCKVDLVSDPNPRIAEGELVQAERATGPEQEEDNERRKGGGRVLEKAPEPVVHVEPALVAYPPFHSEVAHYMVVELAPEGEEHETPLQVVKPADLARSLCICGEGDVPEARAIIDDPMGQPRY